MITISLCMIVRDEEETLGRCLASVADAVDEIIIVDTGSVDDTKAVARRFTHKIYDFTWCDDFAKARNYAYDQATMDYQMWLDADDLMLPEDAAKLMALKGTLDPGVDMVTMRYNTHFDAAGNPTLTSCRERLTRRSAGYRWQDPIHECIPLAGNILDADITVTHKKPAGGEDRTRNLRIYEGLEGQGTPFTPRQLYYFARELRDHGQWAKAVYYFESFLDTGEGWFEDNIGACFALCHCYRALGREDAALAALYRSFTCDAPRAEICTEIGYHFMRRQDYRTAAKWFEVAAGLGEPDSQGFILRDYWGYLPHIELCVCYYHLGDIERAKAHNEAAGRLKPDSPAVRQNDRFFADLAQT